VPRSATPHRYPAGPKGYQRSDERLREDISEQLMQSHYLDSSDVTIQVFGAKVILEGTVPNRYMKHEIEDLADAAPGVQDVENRIRVSNAWSGANLSGNARGAAMPSLGTSGGVGPLGSTGGAVGSTGALGATGISDASTAAGTGSPGTHTGSGGTAATSSSLSGGAPTISGASTGNGTPNGKSGKRD
jgi:hypothetical protein